MNEKPYFITIEGIEGVGKTTLSRLVGEYLSAKGCVNELTREPGGTYTAEVIRTLLKDPDHSIDAYTELLLMFASRSHHITHYIKPKLANGISVISDRFVDASYAYQGGGRGVSMDAIRYLDQMICSSLTPDLTVLVTCPADIAMQRVITRAEKIDRIEQERVDFFERAQEAYLSLATNDRYFILDGSMPLQQVKASLIAELDKRFA